MKILDCTLRDGGYYTNWDFNEELVEKYLETVSSLPIDYIEIGYRSLAKKIYFGEFFYTPIETINKVSKKLNSKQKIAIMINTKDIENNEDINYLLQECKNKVHLVRFAVAPNNINKAVLYANKVKELGFEVALNLMYMSQKSIEDIINEINYILNNVSNIDFIYLVDSYGACLPSDIKEKFIKIKQNYSDVAFGFHGHDNIQLAFANSLEAMSAGVDIIDSTISGMGRGAGNLGTELICSYKAINDGVNLDYTNLVQIVEIFNDLKNKYGWGSSLPYMISGFNKVPQGQVMDLISLRRFSTNNIIKIIKNKIHNRVPNKIFEKIGNISDSKFKNNNYDFSILVGGGESVLRHLEGIKILKDKFNILFIHSTTKHLNLFLEEGFNNLVCLPGDEVQKASVLNNRKTNLDFIISSDSEIHEDYLNSHYYTIGTSSIDDLFINQEFTKDAPLFMALKVNEILQISNFYLIGFDGYDLTNQKNIILREENQNIIDNYLKLNKQLISLTPSKYNIEVHSLYSLIVHG